MKQLALIPGLADDRIGYWLTPPEVMRPLENEFRFTFDACPYPRPAGFNGLTEDWGDRTYVNPPFRGGIVPWARKAIQEHSRGKLVVLILPTNRIDHVVAPLLDAGAETRLLRPVRWVDEKGKRTRRPAPCILFILRPI